MKRWSILLIMLGLLIVLSYDAKAFGIATPYFENDTIALEPGQTFLYTIKIQNNEATSFYVNLSYTSDNSIASLNSTEFFIPEKSYDNESTFIITIPNLSMPETTYGLYYSATPLINNSGQVPMNVEIKRSAYFNVVSEGGVGYFTVLPTPKDLLIRGILRMLNASYIYIISLIVLVVAIIVVMRLWHISKGMIAQSEQKAPYTISEAKSIKDLNTLIRMMPNYIFNNEYIRKAYSKKFEEFNEHFLSNKVLTADKSDMLRILR